MPSCLPDPSITYYDRTSSGDYTCLVDTTVGVQSSTDGMYLMNMSDQASGNVATSSVEACGVMPVVDSIGQQMIGSMNVSDDGGQNDQQRHLQQTRRHDDKSKSQQFQPHEVHKKANHSEIEKRRREKMNSCIKELASMIPICSGMSRKLDKLTVLRLAVQHLKTIKGDMNTPGADSSQARPSFLTDKKIYDLILKVAEGFLFVVSCDRGKILFITESVAKVLNYERGELLGQNLFDILHPKDVAKVKEQLTNCDLLTKKERYVDSKTMLPVSCREVRAGMTSSAKPSSSSTPSSGQTVFSLGARRSFFCRMKTKPSFKVKEEVDTTTNVSRNSKKRKNSLEKKYTVIHCLGYIKSWSSSVTSTSGRNAPKSSTRSEDDDGDSDGCSSFNLSCLVAVAKTLPPFSPPTNHHERQNEEEKTSEKQSNSSTNQPQARPKNVSTQNVQYVTRHAMDGKFVFVDQREVFILGWLPQELLGTSTYEYCHPEDVRNLADSHRLALASKTDITSKPYRYKTKGGSYLYIQTKWTNFKNPFTKEFEFLVARNTCVPDAQGVVDSSSSEIVSETKNVKQEDCHRSPSDEPDAPKGLPCLDEIMHNLQSPKSGPSSNENSIGSNSENRVKKLLSSSRVNLWKIGKQIEEEALDNQRRSTDTSGDSISSPAGGSRSNVSSNASAVAGNLDSWSAGAESTSGSGDFSDRTTHGKDSTSKGGSMDSRTGGGNGSDSGNSSSTYSSNTFYNGSNSNQLSLEQEASLMLLSSASSLASQARNHAVQSQSHSASTSNSSSPGLLINCPSSDPLLTSSAAVDLATSSIGTGSSSNVEPTSSSCVELPSSSGIDDAAMALVLSLLESDAGFEGGSEQDFNGIQWPSF